MPSGPLCIIAIAGPSCAGKGTLAAWLAERLPASILPVDAYYRPLDHLTLAQRAEVNFDEPSSIDHNLLSEHLSKLVRGQFIERPVYDFARHTRKAETVRLEPHGFLIIEGLFALYWESVRSLLSASIYVEAPNSTCLDRRVARDQRERGRTEESVRTQYEDTVRPMREMYVEPARQYAGLVLDGTAGIEVNGQHSLDYIRQCVNEQVRLKSKNISAAIGLGIAR